MKTVKVKVHCVGCDFRTEFDLNTNEYGMFVVPQAYCPNDFFVLDQDIMGHIKSITDEDSNES
jgi:hypothetical protein